MTLSSAWRIQYSDCLVLCQLGLPQIVSCLPHENPVCKVSLKHLRDRALKLHVTGLFSYHCPCLPTPLSK